MQVNIYYQSRAMYGILSRLLCSFVSKEVDVEKISPQFSAGSEELWHDLANAVVVDAVRQYRKLKRKQRAGERLGKAALEDLQEIEEFFQSEWFELFTDVDGVALLKKLQAETTFIQTRYILP